MSQLDLPLPPSTGDLDFSGDHTPITYCAHCGVVVAVSEAIRSHTDDYCTIACRNLHREGRV